MFSGDDKFCYRNESDTVRTERVPLGRAGDSIPRQRRRPEPGGGCLLTGDPQVTLPFLSVWKDCNNLCPRVKCHEDFLGLLILLPCGTLNIP